MKRPSSLFWKILSGISFLALVAIGIGINQIFLDATTGFQDDINFHVYPQAELEQITDSLSHLQILEKRTGFVWLAKATGWDDSIKAGHYTAKPGMSNKDILDMLRRGIQTPIHMVVPGGTRKERLIRGMARNMAFSESDLAAVLADEQLALELQTDTTHLWAFMVPDTYFFYWLASPQDVVRRLKKRYDEVIHAKIEEAGSLPENLTPDEVVRMAGIVEWESAYVPEKATIAGVYFNRIRNGWRLDADPTIQYAIMKIEGEKRRLFFKDYKLDDPYNTYKHRGLPPGPITNPSLTSIQGVLNPAEHGYFFFVAKGDGQHLFSSTLSEHTRKAQEYYRVMRARRAAQKAAEAS